jgi:hypothetical protein
MKRRRSGGSRWRAELAKLAHCGIPTLDACWLCSGAGTATARTLSARQRLGYTGHVIVGAKWPSPDRVLRVDCGACNHVALLTQRAC